MALAAWTLLDKTLALQTRIFKVLLARYRMPRTGQESTFSQIDSADWVNVVAIDKDENLILIRQFRVGIGDFTLEVPGGMVDPGEHPRDTAERELYEESGYRAERIVDLGYVEPNPAIFNNRAYMFLAEGCERVGAQVLDEGEDIEIVPTPLMTALDMLHTGQITHALVSVALARYELHAAGKLSLDPSRQSRKSERPPL